MFYGIVFQYLVFFSRIHVLSKDAQLRILNILSINDASFYDKMHGEYYVILKKLIKYYNDATDKQPTEICLQHFSPEQVIMPTAQLKLEPIYVNVRDLNTCKSMIQLTLLLLSESMVSRAISIDKYKKEYESVFQEVLNIWEHFGADLKLASLRFFADLLINYEQVAISKFQHNFPEIFRSVLFTFEAMVKSLHIYYEKCEVDKIYIEKFRELSLMLLKMVEKDIDLEYTDILETICTVILRTKGNEIFGKELKLYCLSLSSKISLPEDLISIKKCDASEIDMLAECYCKNIILYIQSNVENKRSVKLSENWYYNEIIGVFQELRKYDSFYNEKLLIQHTLKRNRAALKIMLNVSICGKKLYTNKEYHRSYSMLLEKRKAINILDLLLSCVTRFQTDLLMNYDILKLMLDVILNTVALSDVMTVEETNKVLQLICLQHSPIFSNFHFDFDERVTGLLLQQALITKIVLKNSKVNDAWSRFMSLLFSHLIKNKSVGMYTQVSNLVL